MKSTTTYLEAIRKDIENVQHLAELDEKYIQWCQNVGRDAVTFFPDLVTNEEGWKWLRIIGENLRKFSTRKPKKSQKSVDKQLKVWYNKGTIKERRTQENEERLCRG